MKIVAIVDDDDCGPFAVIDEDSISIVKCSDFYIVATISAYTGRPITCEISYDCVEKLMQNGVRCLDFNDDTFPTKEIIDRKPTE